MLRNSVLGLLFFMISACAGAEKAPEAAGKDQKESSPSPIVIVSPKPSPSPSPSPAPSPSPKASPQAKPSSTPKAVTKKNTALAQLPPLLKEIEEKYAKAGTLVADFSQVNEVAALGQKKKSSGNIAVKRPGKVRWQTLSPDANLLVSDGKTFWFYTPPFDEEEPGQVIVRKASEIQSKLANALLAGSFSSVRGAITEKAPNRFVLKPRKGTAGTVNRAEIEVNPSEKVIQKVVLEHEGGNRSEITLSDVELGKPLADDVFHFDPPPNTERVD